MMEQKKNLKMGLMIASIRNSSYSIQDTTSSDTHVGEEKDMDGLSDAGDVGNSVPVPLRFFIAIAFDAA